MRIIIFGLTILLIGCMPAENVKEIDQLDSKITPGLEPGEIPYDDEINNILLNRTLSWQEINSYYTGKMEEHSGTLYYNNLKHRVIARLFITDCLDSNGLSAKQCKFYINEISELQNPPLNILATILSSNRVDASENEVKDSVYKSVNKWKNMDNKSESISEHFNKGKKLLSKFYSFDE